MNRGSNDRRALPSGVRRGGRRAARVGLPGWVGGAAAVALLAATFGGVLLAASLMPQDGRDGADAGRYQAGLLVDRVGVLRDPAAAPFSADSQAWPFGRSSVVIEAQAPVPGAPENALDVAVGKLPRSACEQVGALVGPGLAVAAASVNGTAFGSGATYPAPACLPDVHSKSGFRARNLVVLRVERGSAPRATVLPASHGR